MTAHPSTSPSLRRSGGVGAAGASSGLSPSGNLPNSAGVSDSKGMPAPSRHCAYPPCGKPLVMGRREGPKKFAARNYCNMTCRNAHHFAKASSLDHWPPTKAELQALVAKGLSISQMADALGCSETTVVKLRKDHGLGAANPRGRHKFVKPQDLPTNWRQIAQPKRTDGKFASIDEWLAAGNEPAKCPTAYCAPVITGTPAYGKHGGRVV